MIDEKNRFNHTTNGFTKNEQVDSLKLSHVIETENITNSSTELQSNTSQSVLRKLKGCEEPQTELNYNYLFNRYQLCHKATHNFPLDSVLHLFLNSVRYFNVWQSFQSAALWLPL